MAGSAAGELEVALVQEFGQEFGHLVINVLAGVVGVKLKLR